MTVYTWQAEGVVDDPVGESRKSYGLPPIEWFVYQYHDTKTDMILEDVLCYSHNRRALLIALEADLDADPARGEMTEIVLEVLSTGYSLYRMDYYGKEIRLSLITDVLRE